MRLSSYKTVVLFAGGVGITPIISIALDLAAQAGKSKRASGKTQFVHLVWVNPNADPLQWFSQSEDENDQEASPLNRLKNSKLVKLHVYASRAKESCPDGSWAKGRPNVDSLFQQVLEEVTFVGCLLP